MKFLIRLHFLRYSYALKGNIVIIVIVIVYLTTLSVTNTL
jgi:hypothetical protein